MGRAPLQELRNAVESVEYSILGQGLTRDTEETRKRNLNCGDDNISAYFAEH